MIADPHEADAELKNPHEKSICLSALCLLIFVGSVGPALRALLMMETIFTSKTLHGIFYLKKKMKKFHKIQVNFRKVQFVGSI